MHRTLTGGTDTALDDMVKLLRKRKAWRTAARDIRAHVLAGKANGLDLTGALAALTKRGDRAAAAAQVAGAPGLRYLVLDDNRLGPEGARALALPQGARRQPERAGSQNEKRPIRTQGKPALSPSCATVAFPCGPASFTAALDRCMQWLVHQNNVGSINRQEAVSMIPPMLLDVQPGHTVLDMCAGRYFLATVGLFLQNLPCTDADDAV